MNRTTKTLTYVIGIIMTIAMVGSLILPMLSSNIGQAEIDAEAGRPTPLPAPTFPPPPDTATISFDSKYLHNSGLFTLGAPTGWSPTAGSNTASELRASLTNADLLSVIEARISKDQADLADSEALSAFLDKTWLSQTWSGYSRWDETSRKITADGIVQIDFNLSRGRSHMIARQESWLEGGDIYSVRVVMAENAPDELKYILRGVIDSIERLPIYAEAPFGWAAYFDNLDKHIVRYPSDWELTDAAEGLPATIVGDGASLVLSTIDVAVNSEDDAIDWIQGWRSGVKARSVEAVEVDGSAGYKVSYRLSTLDGATESGLAIMLNGADNRLHVANLRLNNISEDLLEVEPSEFPWLAAIDSFRLLPDLQADLQ